MWTNAGLTIFRSKPDCCHILSGAVNSSCHALALRSARQSRGLSVRCASAAIGVSASTLKRWERGEHLPSPVSLVGVLDQWGVGATAPSRRLITDGTPAPARCWSIERSETRPLLRLLRSRRRRNGLTLGDVETLTGIGASSLHRHETGERIPSAETLERIAGAVGCSQQETATLSSCLYAPDHDPKRIDIFSEFLQPDSVPHVLVFEAVDRLLRRDIEDHQGAQEQIWQAGYGLMLMADYKSLLELGPTIQSISRRNEGPCSSLLRCALILAQIHTTGKLRAHDTEFQRSVDLANRLEDFETQMSFGMMAVRLGIAICDFAGARLQLQEQVRRGYRAGREDLQMNFNVYQAYLDLEEGNPLRAVRIADKLRENAKGTVQHYTVNVLEARAQSRIGDTARLGQILDECGAMERQYGIGSPLLNRLRASLEARTRRASPPSSRFP